MTFRQLVAFYGSQAAAARAAGVTKGAVQLWRSTGVPKFRQIQFERLSGGKLVADARIFGKAA